MSGRRVIAVPIGICTQSMFGVGRICAVLLRSVFELSVAQSSLCLLESVHRACLELVGSAQFYHGVYSSCRAVIAVPIGICVQSMFGVGRICTVLCGSAFGLLRRHPGCR